MRRVGLGSSTFNSFARDLNHEAKASYPGNAITPPHAAARQRCKGPSWRMPRRDEKPDQIMTIVPISGPPAGREGGGDEQMFGEE